MPIIAYMHEGLPHVFRKHIIIYMIHKERFAFYRLRWCTCTYSQFMKRDAFRFFLLLCVHSDVNFMNCCMFKFFKWGSQVFFTIRGNARSGQVLIYELLCCFKKRSVFYYTQIMLLFPPDSEQWLPFVAALPRPVPQVLQWVSFADSEIVPPASAWVFPTLGIMQFNKQVSFEYICVMVASVRNWPIGKPRPPLSYCCPLRQTNGVARCLTITAAVWKPRATMFRSSNVSLWRWNLKMSEFLFPCNWYSTAIGLVYVRGEGLTDRLLFCKSALLSSM